VTVAEAGWRAPREHRRGPPPGKSVGSRLARSRPRASPGTAAPGSGPTCSGARRAASHGTMPVLLRLTYPHDPCSMTSRSHVRRHSWSSTRRRWTGCSGRRRDGAGSGPRRRSQSSCRRDGRRADLGLQGVPAGPPSSSIRTCTTRTRRLRRRQRCCHGGGPWVQPPCRAVSRGHTAPTVLPRQDTVGEPPPSAASGWPQEAGAVRVQPR
jgi:hypothetical protein